MALGTPSFVDQDGAQPSAPVFLDRIKFAGDSSYTTGGYAGFKAYFQGITKDQRQPLAVIAQARGGATTMYVASYDYTNDKLQFFEGPDSTAPLAEVGSGTDLSAVTFEALVFSK